MTLMLPLKPVKTPLLTHQLLRGQAAPRLEQVMAVSYLRNSVRDTIV